MFGTVLEIHRCRAEVISFIRRGGVPEAWCSHTHIQRSNTYKRIFLYPLLETSAHPAGRLVDWSAKSWIVEKPGLGQGRILRHGSARKSPGDTHFRNERSVLVLGHRCFGALTINGHSAGQEENKVLGV